MDKARSRLVHQPNSNTVQDANTSRLEIVSHFARPPVHNHAIGLLLLAKVAPVYCVTNSFVLFDVSLRLHQPAQSWRQK